MALLYCKRYFSEEHNNEVELYMHIMHLPTC